MTTRSAAPACAVPAPLRDVTFTATERYVIKSYLRTAYEMGKTHHKRYYTHPQVEHLSTSLLSCLTALLTKRAEKWLRGAR